MKRRFLFGLPFTTKMRDRYGKRRLRRTRFVRRIVGRDATPRPPATFFALALPGLVAGLLGLPALLGPARPVNGFAVFAIGLICAVLALRAATANAGLGVRIAAAVFCCLYPALALLR